MPKVISKYQDGRVAMLVYEDVFCCDLGTAIASGTIEDGIKPYFAACILSALTNLHKFGLMHRYVTPEAVYITDTGRPKLSDLRYCKSMDGDKSYTICGDPCYFAPEIIRLVQNIAVTHPVNPHYHHILSCSPPRSSGW